MYFPRLDTVRCYAVAAVVFAHIFQIWTWQPDTVSMFPLGHSGVVVFFVLSGFLITRILMREPKENSLFASFKNFYMRRTLRIFPIYYLYLLVAFLFNLDDIQRAGVYPWIYLGNIWMFLNDSWLDANSHLWSLSVEEQFYIIAPFFILFLRGGIRYLAVLFTLIIIFSLLVRAYLLLNGYSTSPQIEVFTLACVDFLAVGGLLAVAFEHYGEKIKRFGLPILFSSIGIYYLSFFMPSDFSVIYWSIGKLMVATSGAGIIIYAIFAADKNGIFHNPITMHIGKISYGIYLYHNLIVAYYAEIMHFFGINVGNSIVVKIIVSLALTLIVAQLSFSIIEKPLLRLKNKFR